jgi:23S rRNA-/tRNA-specific pseudouridylate synthase
MAEVGLLAKTDELHGWLRGPATKRILEREYEVYGHAQFEKISGISVAQIYNLRHSKRYRVKRYIHTKPVVSRIGERARPESQGRPQGIYGSIPYTREMIRGKKGYTI